MGLRSLGFKKSLNDIRAVIQILNDYILQKDRNQKPVMEFNHPPVSDSPFQFFGHSNVKDTTQE